MHKNVVTAMFLQSFAWINKAGEPKTFDEEQEFFTDTIQEISAKELALWLLAQCKHFIKLQRLQGKKGFMLSKPITLKLKVNNREVSYGFKFSLSLPRLEKLLQVQPELVAESFVVAPHIKNTSGLLNYITGAGANMLIAKAVKQIEAPQIVNVAPALDGVAEPIAVMQEIGVGELVVE